MVGNKLKHSSSDYLTKRKLSHGFTLIELVLVIMILGIMAAGIGGFISLSTQTYLNASSRDELIGNARFVVERLNRELRNALPSSIRTKEWDGDTVQCIQFTPIVASTVYTDIPVLPEPASQTLSVIPFNGSDGTPYQCASGCSDLVTVYPLNNDDVYADYSTTVGKLFRLGVIEPLVDPGQLNIPQAVSFAEDSPTQRLYIINEQVSYCAIPGYIVRFSEPVSDDEQTYPIGIPRTYMAGYLVNDISGHLPFSYLPPTLKRNAVVQIHLQFTNDGEDYVFDHEVHISNVP
ncbi:PilW family protein [Colwellia piezophila]|uniref:PilW family protein n=1 Tax=Colwellia piezophila TaxID=211668 RepID=UPI0003795FD4|nr:type II secretion system protein [Colwellia piezophila]